MPDNKPHIVILGAGPGGVGAAYQLARQKKAKVTVLEMQDRVGGNAGSFELDGIYFDYGSHRLHPACSPEILKEIQELLKNDLLLRPRHGRIRLNNRWIHFPLISSELITRLPFNFAIGVMKDVVQKAVPGIWQNNGEGKTFAGLLQRQLGKTICEEFYFPYARKIWGLPPDQISAVQAQKRVGSNSFGKLIKKIFSKSGNHKLNGRPAFYYPKYGYGQISDILHKEAAKFGANFIFNARVKKIMVDDARANSVLYEHDDSERTLQADFIWSTLPITLMVQGMQPQPDKQILEAAQNMKFRAMILIYLILQRDKFTEFDAHYFPGEDIPITRLSEVKNYSNTKRPQTLTGLCAELPCSIDEEYWKYSDEELAELVRSSLRNAEIPITAPVRKVVVKRIKHAYPVYQTGFEDNFQLLDQYLDGFENLLTFGRQGLFVHDNTHHALYMAYSAANCLDENGNFDKQKWLQYRHEFESHVVED